MEIQELLSASGIAVAVASITALLGVVFKYMTERRSMTRGERIDEITRLQQRVQELEQQHIQCLRENADLQKRVGYLEARVERFDKGDSQ